MTLLVRVTDANEDTNQLRFKTRLTLSLDPEIALTSLATLFRIALSGQASDAPKRI